MTITEFIEAQIAEDEQIAQSTIDPERPGTHWCWEDGERNPLQPGVEVKELDTQAISLRTVEEYPTRHVGPLPAFLLCQVEARQQGALWHIARQDPDRTLRQVEAFRKVVAAYRGAVLAKEQGSVSARNVAQDEAAVDVLGYVIECLASIYADPAETKDVP